jgi:thioredoxin 1
MKKVTEKDFNGEVLQSKGMVLVDFYADWCGPCQFLSPSLESLEQEMQAPDVKFVKVNVDENQMLSRMYGVMSIPTVVLFKDGKIVEQKIGVSPKEDYKMAIEKARQ